MNSINQNFSGSFANTKARRSVLVILVSITALAIVALFFISLTYFRALDREAASVRLSLYERSLNDTLERYQYFPFVLAQDPLVKNGLSRNNIDILNERLAQFVDKSGLEAIYLMDTSGTVLASSNFDKPFSFINQNYGFRPYFQQSRAGARGNYFGVGATTGRPGYFVSEPVTNHEGKIAGVIAIKLDASELQSRWEAGGENVFASNPDGMIVLASNKDWLFKSLTPLSPEKIEAIKATKQFGLSDIDALNWETTGPEAATLAGETFVYSKAEVEQNRWTVHYLLSNNRAYERALLTTVIFGAGISVLVGFATFMRSRRIQHALAMSQMDRDKLLDTNLELEKAHSELARTSKLAALGQLSASVVHELGQPISALRNYLAAEEIDAGATPRPSLGKLNGVVDRMESITKQLRFFTKPGEEDLKPVALKEVLESSLALMNHDFAAAKIDPKLDLISNATVLGNQLRLEQVMVNLLQNALSALRDAENHELVISLERHGTKGMIRVADDGIGFGDRDLSEMQEPFHTTRSSGDGMGLGLSIASAIIKDHEGQLSAENRKGGGAIFTVELPAIDEKDKTKS